ncbi:50S ribosomal protein L23 [candidate division LCP-89 bacterium B3_LCP]|uniref:Large ribosomal subunit protein uL23 n=1 Tax=candidate division LCP-89 bacterium B3_LCP TaxID=2012998 RepID=A0A532UZN8_UNCL8|nr:MAG: 50S ribosomal protein L23 [candidate division LCP-89 bacterium B3_LCP]
MLKDRPILKRPLLTEKSTKLQDTLNQVAFEVDRDANKLAIRKAVEERFEVKVTKVRTMQYRGKIKTMGRFSGPRSSWKKAIVTLAEGQKIEFFENV